MNGKLVEILPRKVEIIKAEKGGLNLEWNVEQAHMGVTAQVSEKLW